MKPQRLIQLIDQACKEEHPYLYLSGNRLTTLPPEIGNLTQLQELELSANRLTTLPPEIGNLTQLQELELSTNSLTTLPPEIGNLPQLGVRSGCV